MKGMVVAIGDRICTSRIFLLEALLIKGQLSGGVGLRGIKVTTDLTTQDRMVLSIGGVLPLDRRLLISFLTMGMHVVWWLCTEAGRRQDSLFL